MSHQPTILDFPPAHAAWVAAGEPTISERTTAPGQRCTLCRGTGHACVDYRDIVDRRFTDFEHWDTGLDQLCLPCAWSYLTDKPRLLVVTVDGRSDDASPRDVQSKLTAAALSSTCAVICGGRRRKYVLPTARWGHVNGEHAALEWTSTAAERLRVMCRLREFPGVTATDLAAVQPPIAAMRATNPSQWTKLLEDWAALQPWREHPGWWATALTLSIPEKSATR